MTSSEEEGSAHSSTFWGAPYLGIWTNPKAPFVCIEPWFGIDDDYKHLGCIEDKKGIVELRQVEEFVFENKLEVLG